MNEHLIFFDAECPLCHKAVRHLIEIDVKKRIVFAPLGGLTAQNVLSGPQSHLKKANSLILVENYQSTNRKFWVRSKAVLRTYWLIGDGWGLIGILSFLPSYFGDAIYRKVALHRHQFKLKMPLEGPAERFLP